MFIIGALNHRPAPCTLLPYHNLDKIIERIGRSPNAGDAAALTFAQVVIRQEGARRRPMVESAYDEHRW